MPPGPGSDATSGVLRPGRLTPRTVFLHFFDPHFLEERNALGEKARDEMDLAVRFAVMIAERIYVPAASWYETPIARQVLTPFVESSIGSAFVLAGSGASPEAFHAEKLEQYGAKSRQGEIYRAPPDAPAGWRKRSRSATKDIIAGWRRSLEDGAAKGVLARMMKAQVPGDMDRIFEQAPDRLAGQAFIVDNIAPLVSLENDFLGRQSLHELINAEYFRSYGADFKAAVFQNMSALGNDPVASGAPDDDIDYGALVKACQGELLRAIRSSNPADLEAVGRSDEFRTAFSFSQTRPADRSAVAVRVAAAPLSVEAILGPLAVDLAIVVALPKEREAVEAVFGRGRPYKAPDDPYLYSQIMADVGGRTRRIMLVTLSEMGNANAAAAASNMFRSFKPKRTVMIGIAGGCPDPSSIEDHVRLGDVVISTKVLEYDNIKRHADGHVERRDSPQRVGHEWIQAAKSLQMEATTFDPAWRKIFQSGLRKLGIKLPDRGLDVLHDAQGELVAHPSDPRRSKTPQLVHLGVIAAGDTLLKDPNLRDELRDQAQVRAVEMESSGLRTASWVHGGTFVAIRGVVDYCDGYKSNAWHGAAATAAAAVASLMFKTLIEADEAGIYCGE
jgi:nucleoside phosphorylase